MKCRGLKTLTFLFVGVCALTGFAANAAATPTGLLVMGSGAGGVTVGFNFVDWTPPIGGANGSFVVSGGTTLTSALGGPPVGSLGTILDLNAAPPIANFMTFAAVPGLAFDLATIGPGSANTNCGGLGIGESCSIFTGSPFILTFTGTGTAVALSASGIARDGTVPSNWSGAFTTQIAGQTPANIQSLFGCPGGSGPGACTNPGATVQSSYSGEFLIQVPEPTSLALLGMGLVSLAMYQRKKA